MIQVAILSETDVNEECLVGEWVKLAELKEDSGKPKEALSLYHKAVRAEPDNLEIRCKYALCCAMCGRAEKAIDLLCEILDNNSEYMLALESLGKVMAYLGYQCGSKGWFTLYESGFLYRTIQSLESDAPVIVELGSCFGLSSMIIAKALKNKPNAKIYCVDAWEGDGSSVFGDTREFIQGQAQEGLKFIDIFKGNMERAGVLHQLTPTQGYTTEVVKTWQEQADIVFVDADHSYEGVRADVKNWKDFVKVGGLLLMHDVELLEAGSKKDSGPGLVVQEFLGDDSNYAPGILVDTLYAAERIK